MPKEYGIVGRRSDPSDLHRGPWPEDQVDAWLKEWVEAGGLDGAFVKVSRPVGEWERDA